MAYEYRVNEKEAEARNYLKDRGWKVEEPTCPECAGLGSVLNHKSVRLKKGQRTMSGAKYTIEFYYTPCPNECSVPAMYFNTQEWGTSRT